MKRVLGPHGLVGAVLVAAPLAVGSVHSGPRTIFGMVLLIAALWMFAVRARHLRLGAAGLGLLLALAWTVLQMVPLPLSASSAIARDAMSAATALGEQTSWVPITRDLGASAELAWYLAAALALYMVVVRSSGRARRLILQCIALSGALMVLSGVVHGALGATTLFGSYVPNTDLRQMRLPMPLLNPNHAAVLLILSAASAWILAITTARPRVGHLYRAMALASFGGIIATDSNAGLVVMVGGCVALVYIWRKTQKTRKQRRAGPELLLLVPLVLAGMWVLESDVNFSDRWSVGWEIARDHLGVGVGGGAFPMAASKYQSTWATGQLTFAHNGLLQAVAEWGAFAATGIGLLLMQGLVAAWRVVPITMERMIAMVAVAAAVLANQVEFSLWLPGVGLPAAALLAWAVADARRCQKIAEKDQRKSMSDSEQASAAPSGRSVSQRTSGWFTRSGVVVVCLALIPIGAMAHQEALIANRESARDHLTNNDLDKLIHLARKHPSDQNVWLHVARLLAHREDPRAADAVTHALSLAPKRTEHLILCGLHAPDESALDCLLRVTSMGSRQRSRAAAAAIARDARAGKGFSEAFGRRSGPAALSLADALKSQGFETYSQAILWAYQQHPSDPRVCERLVLLWANDGRQHDALGAIASVLFARAEEASSAMDASLLRRSAYVALGAVALKTDPKAAAHAFEAAARQAPKRGVKPLLRAIDIWVSEQRPDAATRVLKRLEKTVAVASLPKEDRVTFHVLRSRVATMSGDRMKAMAELRRARAFSPDDVRLREHYQRLQSADERSGNVLLR